MRRRKIPSDRRRKYAPAEIPDEESSGFVCVHYGWVRPTFYPCICAKFLCRAVL